MTDTEFDKLVEREHSISLEMLHSKAAEYASDHDRLQNFKCAAGLRDTTPAEALMGMLVKHFVSVSEMAKEPHSYDMSKWDEKLRDIRNYSYLLKAVLTDMGVE